MRKRVSELQPGDLVDLYGDAFADPRRDPAEGFEFEYAWVEAVELETSECIVVYFLDCMACGFPPSHEVELGGSLQVGEMHP